MEKEAASMWEYKRKKTTDSVPRIIADVQRWTDQPLAVETDDLLTLLMMACDLLIMLFTDRPPGGLPGRVFWHYHPTWALGTWYDVASVCIPA